jgi:hypothetical protein
VIFLEKSWKMGFLRRFLRNLLFSEAGGEALAEGAEDGDGGGAGMEGVGEGCWGEGIGVKTEPKGIYSNILIINIGTFHVSSFKV